jgi:hypothetical protein
MRISAVLLAVALIVAAGALRVDLAGQTPVDQPKAFIDGTGPGWRTLGPNDFARVNDDPDTWRWDGDVLTSTGVPIGVRRTRAEFRNFELVIEWRHLKSAGNSGVFAWVPMKALDGLPRDALPKWGIEVQMLDTATASGFANGTPASRTTGSRPTATSSPSATRSWRRSSRAHRTARGASRARR